MLSDSKISKHPPLTFLPPPDVWQPHAGAQTLAMQVVAREILFYGTRNAGKTITQLMRWLSRVGVGYGRWWQGLIVDVSRSALEDMVAQSQQFFYRHPIKMQYNTQESLWTAKTGEQLRFRLLARPRQYHENIHGHNYVWIAVNEVTKYPNSQLIDMLLSVNRVAKDFQKPPELPDLRPEIFYTANTEGTGGGAKWVRRRYEGCGTTKSDSPINYAYHRDSDGYDYAIICGYYRENKSIDAEEYEATLDRATKNNPDRHASWKHAMWVTTGGALGDVWSDNCLLEINPLDAPKTWSMFVAFFWGASKPYCAGWFAVADGVESLAGQRFPSGSLILLHELYGGEEIGENKGTNKTPSGVVMDIIKETQDVFGTNPTCIVVSEIVGKGGTYTIQHMLERSMGTEIETSNDNDGARQAGLQMVRDALDCNNDARRLLIAKRCKASVETIPDVRVEEDNPDVVSLSTEISCYDMCRIALQHEVNEPILMEVNYG